jgi:hypothetical protein
MRLAEKLRGQYPSSRTFSLSMRRKQRHLARVAKMPVLLSCKKRVESDPGLLANMLRNKERVPRVQAREVRVLPPHPSHPKRRRPALHSTPTGLITFHLWSVSPTPRPRGGFVRTARSFYVAQVKIDARDASNSSQRRLPMTPTTVFLIHLEPRPLKLTEMYPNCWNTVSWDPIFTITPFPA